MKKMLYSTMLLAALMNCYSMMEANARNDKSTWLGGNPTTWSPYPVTTEEPVIEKFESRARVQPAMGKVNYEQLQPAEKASMFKETVQNLKETAEEVKNQGKTLPPSANTQIKRALERADAAYNHLIAQVRPSEVKGLKTVRTHVPVDATPSEKSYYRLETLSDISDNLTKVMPVRLNTAVNDALNKAQIHVEKALKIVKKEAA